MMRRHHPREVAARLTMREFCALTSHLDEKYGEIIAASAGCIQHGSGAKLGVGERRKQVQFHVLEIQRGDTFLFVRVDLGNGIPFKNIDMSAVASKPVEGERITA